MLIARVSVKKDFQVAILDKIRDIVIEDWEKDEHAWMSPLDYLAATAHRN